MNKSIETKDRALEQNYNDAKAFKAGLLFWVATSVIFIGTTSAVKAVLDKYKEADKSITQEQITKDVRSQVSSMDGEDVIFCISTESPEQLDEF